MGSMLIGVGIGLAVAALVALPVAWWLLRRALAAIRRMVMLALVFAVLFAGGLAALGAFVMAAR